MNFYQRTPKRNLLSKYIWKHGNRFSGKTYNNPRIKSPKLAGKTMGFGTFFKFFGG